MFDSLRGMAARFRDFFRGPMGYPGCQGAMGAPGHDANDIRCPHCHTWLSELTKEERAASSFTLPSINPKYKDDGYFATYRCGHEECNKDSDWFTGAPVLLLADSVNIVVLKPQDKSSCSK